MRARMLYIGVDVHEESQVAVYEERGELLQQKRLPTSRFQGSSPLFALQGAEKHVGIESVGFIVHDASSLGEGHIPEQTRETAVDMIARLFLRRWCIRRLL